MSLQRICIKLIAPAIVYILFCPQAFAQTQAPVGPPDKPPADRPPRPASTFALLKAQLSSEGIDALKTGRLVRAHPSIAADFPHEVPKTQIAQAIAQTQHMDPFVDAYIRWQLTSFNISMPVLPDGQWERMVEGLPLVPINPRADEGLIKLLNQGLNAGELSAEDQLKIAERIEIMNEIESNRRELMTPAMELRQWLIEQSRDSLYRRIVLAVERCAALVRSGWPTGEHGAAAAELYAEAARDREITDEQKRKAAAVAQGFIGMTRVYVTSARINDGRLEVNFENTAIYDFDVRKWIRSMEQ